MFGAATAGPRGGPSSSRGGSLSKRFAVLQRPSTTDPAEKSRHAIVPTLAIGQVKQAATPARLEGHKSSYRLLAKPVPLVATTSRN
jgi:hypothetical protein